MDLYLYRADEQTGPYTEAEVWALVTSGQITRTCLVWHEGMAEWRSLEEVVALPKPPAVPPVAEGLPPVPTRPRPPATMYLASTHTPRPAKSAKPMTVWSFINTCGSGLIGIVILVRWLSGCHHQ